MSEKVCKFNRYILMGEPVPWKRPHPNYAQRKMYDEQKHLKLDRRLQLEKQHPSFLVFSGPLQLEACFYFAIPTKVSARQKDSWMQRHHITKPDASNLVKFIEDICNDFIFHDDCMIASLIVTKRYDHIPRTEFVVSELKESV